MTEYTFFQTEKVLWKSKGFFSPKTGEAVSLTSSEKAIYMYLEDRITFFVKNKGSEFFEEQGTIAEELGLEKKTVGRCVKKFEEHGVLYGSARRTGRGNLLWFYTGINKDLKFWSGSEKEPKPLTGVQTKQQSKKSFVNNYDDGEGSPF